MASSRTVDANGRLSSFRDETKKGPSLLEILLWKDASWTRWSLVLLIFGIGWLTNPLTDYPFIDQWWETLTYDFYIPRPQYRQYYGSAWSQPRKHKEERLFNFAIGTAICAGDKTRRRKNSQYTIEPLFDWGIVDDAIRGRSVTLLTFGSAWEICFDNDNAWQPSSYYQSSRYFRPYADDNMYDVSEVPRLVHSFLCDVLVRYNLCGSTNYDTLDRPNILWYPYDRPLTTHRILCWIYIVVALICWCTKPRVVTTLRDYAVVRRQHTTLVGSFWGFFLPSSMETTATILVSTISKIYTANVVLFPVWQRMEYLIAMQSTRSWFRLFVGNETTESYVVAEDYNYSISLAVFWIVATLLVYVAHKIVGTQGRQTLNFSQQDMLLAVALGYYRGSFGSVNNDSQGTIALFPSRTMALIPFTWTILAGSVMYRQRSVRSMFWTIVAWIAIHTTGAMLGDYQYQNQDMVYAAWKGMQNAFKSLFVYKRKSS